MTPNQRRHSSLRIESVFEDDVFTYAIGDHVMTVDGFAGVIMDRQSGQFGSEVYAIELDDGAGGGEYRGNDISGLVEPKTARRMGVWYHGTTVDLPMGAILEPGHGSVYEASNPNRVYVTRDRGEAQDWAEFAVEMSQFDDAVPTVYEVEPMSPPQEVASPETHSDGSLYDEWTTDRAKIVRRIARRYSDTPLVCDKCGTAAATSIAGGREGHTNLCPNCKAERDERRKTATGSAMVCKKCGWPLMKDWAGYSHAADYRGPRHRVVAVPADLLEDVEVEQTVEGEDGLTDFGRQMRDYAEKWQKGGGVTHRHGARGDLPLLSKDDLAAQGLRVASDDYDELEDILWTRPDHVEAKAVDVFPVSLAKAATSQRGQSLEEGIDNPHASWWFKHVTGPALKRVNDNLPPGYKMNDVLEVKGGKQWCRFRRDSKCYFPKELDAQATEAAGYDVWTPELRGLCTRYMFPDQKACPISEPGPQSGEDDWKPEATRSWGQGGQRVAQVTVRKSAGKPPTARQVGQAWVRYFGNAAEIRQAADELLGLAQTPYGVQRPWASRSDIDDPVAYAKVMLEEAAKSGAPLPMNGNNYARPVGTPALVGGTSSVPVYRLLIIQREDWDDFISAHTVGQTIPLSLASGSPNRSLVTQLSATDDEKKISGPSRQYIPVLIIFQPPVPGIGRGSSEFICSGTFRVTSVRGSEMMPVSLTPRAQYGNSVSGVEITMESIGPHQYTGSMYRWAHLWAEASITPATTMANGPFRKAVSVERLDTGVYIEVLECGHKGKAAYNADWIGTNYAGNPTKRRCEMCLTQEHRHWFWNPAANPDHVCSDACIIPVEQAKTAALSPEQEKWAMGAENYGEWLMYPDNEIVYLFRTPNGRCRFLAPTDGLHQVGPEHQNLVAATYWAAANQWRDPTVSVMMNMEMQTEVLGGGVDSTQTAAWTDVRDKAVRIRRDGGVRIISNTGHTVTAEVQGDHGVYVSSITRVPGTKQRGMWFCFPEDAPVRMADGSNRPISDVQVGDVVISHEGQEREVITTFVRPYEGEMTTVRVAGWPDALVATSNHLLWSASQSFWTNRIDPSTRRKLFGSGRVQDVRVGWAESGSLRAGDYLSFTPIARVDEVVVEVPASTWRRGMDAESVKIDEQLGLFLGWYAAEGGVRKNVNNNEVMLTVSSDEIDVLDHLDEIVRDRFGKIGRRYFKHGGSAVSWRCSERRLANICRTLVPGNARTKRVAPELLTAPLDVQQAFVDGWFGGDGTVHAAQSLRGISMSRDLAEAIVEMGARLGQSMSLATHLQGPGGLPTTGSAEGRSIWRVQTNTGERGRVFFDHGMIWRKIVAVETEQAQLPVYDIEVAEDHSFRAYGQNVHNCGCKWTQYVWARSQPYKRFEGRPCSHSMALLYEVQSHELRGGVMVPRSEIPFGEKVLQGPGDPPRQGRWPPAPGWGRYDKAQEHWSKDPTNVEWMKELERVPKVPIWMNGLEFESAVDDGSAKLALGNISDSLRVAQGAVDSATVASLNEAIASLQGVHTARISPLFKVKFRGEVIDAQVIDGTPVIDGEVVVEQEIVYPTYDPYIGLGFISMGMKIEANIRREAEAEQVGVMVALSPSRDVCERLSKLASDHGLDAEAPEQIHMTLAYCGHTDEIDRDRFLGAVRAFAAQHQSFTGKIQGLGTFLNDDRGVLWATADIAGLAAARTALVEALLVAGTPAKMDHDFTPHITLAYTPGVITEIPDATSVVGTQLSFPTIVAAYGGEWVHLDLVGSSGEIVAVEKVAAIEDEGEDAICNVCWHYQNGDPAVGCQCEGEGCKCADRQWLLEALKKSAAMDPERMGRCFQLAFRYVQANKDWKLVHGAIGGSGSTINGSAPMIGHAWAVSADGSQVWEPIGDALFSASEFKQKFDPVPFITYTWPEALAVAKPVGHSGPWDAAFIAYNDRLTARFNRWQKSAARRMCKQCGSENIYSEDGQVKCSECGASYPSKKSKQPTLHLLHDDDETALRKLREHHGIDKEAKADAADFEFGRKGLRDVVANHGFTVNAHYGEAPTAGFMVSAAKSEEFVVDLDKLTVDDIAEYRDREEAALGASDTYLGAWVSDGKVYLDVSRCIKSREAAMVLARENKQLAIYDLSSHESIDTEMAKAAARRGDGINTCKFCGSDWLVGGEFGPDGLCSGQNTDVWDIVCQQCGSFQIRRNTKKNAKQAQIDEDEGRKAVEEECAKGDYHFSGLIIKALDTGRVLMTQRTPYHNDDDETVGRWEYPGGSIDEGETAIDAAFREFNEETGLELPQGWNISGCQPAGDYLAIHVVVPHESWTTDAALLTRETMGIGWFEPEQIEDTTLARPEVQETDWDLVAEASKTAMFEPRPEGDLLARDGEIIYRRKSVLGDSGVEAWMMDQTLIGKLEWAGPESTGYLPPGEIQMVQVNKNYRMHGIATKMFELGKVIEPRLHHSHTLTDDGEAWSKTVAKVATDAILYNEPQPALPEVYGEEMSDAVEYIGGGDDATERAENGGAIYGGLDPDRPFVPGDLRLAHLAPSAGEGGNEDIAAAASAFLEKQALKTFSPAEQQKLIDEGAADGLGASNDDRLDISNTFYAAQVDDEIFM